MRRYYYLLSYFGSNNASKSISKYVCALGPPKDSRINDEDRLCHTCIIHQISPCSSPHRIFPSTFHHDYQPRRVASFYDLPYIWVISPATNGNDLCMQHRRPDWRLDGTASRHSVGQERVETLRSICSGGMEEIEFHGVVDNSRATEMTYIRI